MHRFFVSKESISNGHVIIKESRVHQIRDVLRMKTGDEITVFDNTGFEYKVSLVKISQKEVLGKVVAKKQSDTEPCTKITLYQSLLTRDKFELVLQKCTEIGVTSFVPVITERSIVRKPEKITSQKLARFKNIIIEATEQSGRGTIPELKQPGSLIQSISKLDDYDLSLVGSLQEKCASLKEILRKTNFKSAKVALFIGPEGGFSDKELGILQNRGVSSFSLGKRVLRTETAAVVASGIILYELE